MLAQARWESCYQHVMAQLKYLISPGSVDASAPAAQRVAHLTPQDQQTLRQALLQVRNCNPVICETRSRPCPACNLCYPSRLLTHLELSRCIDYSECHGVISVI